MEFNFESIALLYKFLAKKILNKKILICAIKFRYPNTVSANVFLFALD